MSPARREPSTLRSLLLVAGLLVVVLAGCDPEREVDSLKQQASAQAKNLADQAASQARSTTKQAEDGAKSQVDRGLARAKKELFGLTDTGALSQSATTWITSQSAPSGEDAAGAVAKGAQLLPIAAEAGRLLDGVVDSDTAIEPIVQKVPPGEEAKLDAKVAEMPTISVVDGVKVGFKKLDAMDTKSVTKERAVLVLWRKDDYLLGFLYRKKDTIDLDALVRDAPRLKALTEKAIEVAR